MPYAILAGALPPERMGVYMGIFNFFIVVPEILAALTFGPLVKNFLHGNLVHAVAVDSHRTPTNDNLVRR